MDQIVTVGLTIASLLLGGAGSLFVQRQCRRERLEISEVDCRLYGSVEIPEDLAGEHDGPERAGVGIDLVADLVNKGTHPAKVRRWTWFVADDERRTVIQPIGSDVCLAQLGEQEFAPPRKLTEGPLGTPFIVGAGEVAVLTFSGIFPGAAYRGLDIGTSRLRVKYWGSEREYEWKVEEEEVGWRDILDVAKATVPGKRA